LGEEVMGFPTAEEDEADEITERLSYFVAVEEGDASYHTREQILDVVKDWTHDQLHEMDEVSAENEIDTWVAGLEANSSEGTNKSVKEWEKKLGLPER
jgi:hypothetical protein